MNKTQEIGDALIDFSRCRNVRRTLFTIQNLDPNKVHGHDQIRIFMLSLIGDR